MLELKNINIQFKYPVIKDGNINIKPCEITLLVGKSGSGKTSLLNILGLLEHQSQYTYIYDNHTITNEEMDEFKRLYISYVFQDYNLIEDISIQDNFKTMFNIVGKKFDKKVMLKLLEDVSIDSSHINSKGKSLSGGEKQRVAIALALVKEPRLLLLDEPTANLDEENENQVVSILQKIKDKGIMIVVATHHPDIYHAQHIYKIEECQIVETKKEINEQHTKISSQQHKKFNPISYAFIHISNHIFIYLILLLIVTASIYNVVNVYMSSHRISQETDQFINAISENEILLINNKDLIDEDQGLYYTDYSKKIDSKVIDDVKEISHVESVYPYYKNTSMGGCVNGKRFDFQKDTYVYDVKYNNTVANLYETNNEMLTIASCHADYKKAQCFEVDENATDGVFISARLAEMLGINQLNNTEIQFYMPIFMGYHYSDGYMANPDGSKATDVITTYPMNILYKEMTYKVQGIYEESADNSQFYDLFSEANLYVDYREIEKIHNEAIADQETMEIYQKYMDEAFLKDHNSQFDLSSSLYVVRVDDSKEVDTVINEVKKLGYDINIKTRADENSRLNEATNEFNYGLMTLPMIILGIVVILVVIMYTYTLHQRKKELSFLKANGLKNGYTLPIIDLAIVLMFSLPITVILNIIYNEFTGGYNTYNLSCFMINLIIVASVFVLCFVANKIYYKHTDVIEELRSK